jgi:tripartite ATP-independent transporter DctM subunit
MVPLVRTARLLRAIAIPIGVSTVGVVIAILFTMMVLIVSEILFRFFFRQSIPGVIEVTEFMMITLAFFGMGNTALKKGHLTVDLVTEHLPRRVQAVLDVFTGLFCLVVVFVMAWQAGLQVGAMRESGDTTGVLGIPYYPMFILVAFGVSLFLLVLLADFFDSLVETVGSQGHRWIRLASIFMGVLVLAAGLYWLWQSDRGSRSVVGIVMLLVLFLLVFARMPIGLAMAFTGFVGFSYLRNFHSGLSLVGIVPLRITESYLLCAVPLFLLMGQFASMSGMSRDLYSTLRAWLGSLRGGLAISTIAGCAAFAAITSSSVVCALTMSALASPEMKRYGYASSLSAGSLAVGGTLGILIPPSMGFILYGILTEQSIGKLFLAGFIPGIILASLLILTVYIICRSHPGMGPPGPPSTFQEKMTSLKNVWEAAVLFGVVMGGLYGGFFTATEAAAIGCMGALLLALAKRKLGKKEFVNSFREAGQMTAMVFVLMIGAYIFNYFLALTRLPFELVGYIGSFEINRFLVLALVLVVYLFLGCIMDVFAAMILTLPLVHPLMTQMGFDPVWFGVIMVILLEVGLITPPIGMNVFFIAGANKDVPMSTIFLGSAFFLPAFFVCLLILICFPQLTLFLPDLIIGRG